MEPKRIASLSAAAGVLAILLAGTADAEMVQGQRSVGDLDEARRLTAPRVGGEPQWNGAFLWRGFNHRLTR